MAKKIIAVAVVLLFCATLGAFAYEKKSKDIPVLATFNQPGHLSLTVTGGYSYYSLGLAASVGAELNLGEFDLGPLPLSWGIVARGILGFGVFGVDLGAAGLAQFQGGFDFGPSLKFQYYAGIGVGIAMGFGYGTFGLGIAQTVGFEWLFSDTFGIAFDNVDIYSFFFGCSEYFAGVGIVLKL
jgi:hypothetical protein